MLIRTYIDGPLFYEFIFNLSFDPHLVRPSGFMLSPWGNEVMISCHVAFFRVICYNPVLQIKMMTNAPPGHVHEDLIQHFSSTIAMEKRERRDGGFGMEMMERRGGGFAMKRERSVRQRFRIGREGQPAVSGSKSK